MKIVAGPVWAPHPQDGLAWRFHVELSQNGSGTSQPYLPLEFAGGPPCSHCSDLMKTILTLSRFFSDECLDFFSQHPEAAERLVSDQE